jgi:hypothetical protein
MNRPDGPGWRSDLLDSAQLPPRYREPRFLGTGLRSNYCRAVPSTVLRFHRGLSPALPLPVTALIHLLTVLDGTRRFAR